jgi:hypothetical protein
MNRWRLLFAGITLSTLCACAGQPVSTTSGAIPAATKTPAVQVAKLPCAEVNSTESITISYPTEAIYRNGAVLPKEEGLACLEVLSDWLKSVPQSRWQVTVSGEDGHGFDPLALAGKRQELLQRFFARQGLELKDWQWQTALGAGEQFRMLELKDSP